MDLEPIMAVTSYTVGLGLLGACGPCTRAQIVAEMLIQAPGVTKENCAQVADQFIAEALKAKHIEPYDDEPAFDMTPAGYAAFRVEEGGAA